MATSKQQGIVVLGTSLRAAAFRLALAIVFVMTVVATPATQAQSYQVIHTFTGGLDGSAPISGLTMDPAGNLYGTSSASAINGSGCGGFGCGAVYKLARRGSGWILTPLYDFAGGEDGAEPGTRVIIGPDGALYGTTLYGGGGACTQSGYTGCGTIFRLHPPLTVCKTALCPWTETVLYRFGGGSDGAVPAGELVFDQAGNIYGTTFAGGTTTCPNGCGVVYKLTPSHGGWTQSVLYSFAGGSDGAKPIARLVFDPAGNLYGTTEIGGGGPCQFGSYLGCGTVFQLTPSRPAWNEMVLYRFSGGVDGDNPFAGVVLDDAGNLYGATNYGGQNGGGTAFDLIPSGGAWIYNLVFSFTGYGFDGVGADLAIKDNSLYGTTSYNGPYLWGTAFKLTRSNGTWTKTDLHVFHGGADGGGPSSNLVFDSSGNLYGTTSAGGSGCAPFGGCGVVFEITQPF